MLTVVDIGKNSFLAIAANEVLHTDGVIRTKSHAGAFTFIASCNLSNWLDLGRNQDVYKALNSVGIRGCEQTRCSIFLNLH